MKIGNLNPRLPVATQGQVEQGQPVQGQSVQNSPAQNQNIFSTPNDAPVGFSGILPGIGNQALNLGKAAFDFWPGSMITGQSG